MRDAEKDLAMCEAATPGPWVVDDVNGVIWNLEGKRVFELGGYEEPDDHLFIAESREALPYWIQRAQAAEAALRWYADQNNYSIPHLGCSPKVMADRGKRAHNTLNEIEVVK
ncbi:hypothetical protein [Brevibacillus borstelensis]|uniref:hypothetical protein n=1 Tax=Brevibacillus borstelensis TaxID=45462 RepID=UPI0030C3EFD3